MEKQRKLVGYVTLALALVFMLALSGPGWSAQVQRPNYSCSFKIPEPKPANLATLARITPEQAKAAAQAARPGFAVKQVELENKNACLV